MLTKKTHYQKKKRKTKKGYKRRSVDDFKSFSEDKKNESVGKAVKNTENSWKREAKFSWMEKVI